MEREREVNEGSKKIEIKEKGILTVTERRRERGTENSTTECIITHDVANEDS